MKIFCIIGYFLLTSISNLEQLERVDLVKYDILAKRYVDDYTTSVNIACPAYLKHTQSKMVHAFTIYIFRESVIYICNIRFTWFLSTLLVICIFIFASTYAQSASNAISVAPWGGKGGSQSWEFILPDGARLTEISVRCGAVLDSISFTYKDQEGTHSSRSFGGTGGTPYVVSFEYIWHMYTRIEVSF